MAGSMVVLLEFLSELPNQKLVKQLAPSGWKIFQLFFARHEVSKTFAGRKPMTFEVLQNTG